MRRTLLPQQCIEPDENLPVEHGSEKLSDAQLELLELEPGVSTVEVQAESERPPVLLRRIILPTLEV
jgi:hypothetical protein